MNFWLLSIFRFSQLLGLLLLPIYMAFWIFCVFYIYSLLLAFFWILFWLLFVLLFLVLFSSFESKIIIGSLDFWWLLAQINFITTIFCWLIFDFSLFFLWALVILIQLYVFIVSILNNYNIISNVIACIAIELFLLDIDKLFEGWFCGFLLLFYFGLGLYNFWSLFSFNLWLNVGYL